MVVLTKKIHILCSFITAHQLIKLASFFFVYILLLAVGGVLPFYRLGEALKQSSHQPGALRREITRWF